MMNSVQVEIFGQTYHIKGVADKKYIRELAAFVDERMKDVQKSTGTADVYRMAILTALNIADELHRLRAQHESAERITAASLERLLEVTGQCHRK
jgi:cell division protein ZapA